MPVEERSVHDLVPVGLRLAVEQDTQTVPALTIERGKEKDEHAQQQTTCDESDIRLLPQFGVLTLAPVHAPHEV